MLQERTGANTGQKGGDVEKLKTPTQKTITKH
jgi:hypothetical protein